VSLNTAEKIFLCVGLIDFGLAFLLIGTALHMAYTKTDEMLEYLKNCTAITARAPLRHGGPWGKLLLIGGIAGIVTLPNFYLKKGELSAEDLKGLPIHLKRKLAILYWGSCGALLLMFVIAAVAELDLV
jgi:hypothetical protein